MNFNKNKLIDKTLKQFYKSYYLTVDTADFVTVKTNQKIYKYIDKNLKNAFRLIDKEDKKHQKRYKKVEKQNDKILVYQNKQQILNLKQSLKSMKKQKRLLKKQNIKQKRLLKKVNRKNKLTLFKKCKNYFRYLYLKRKHLLLTYTKPD